MQACVDCVFVCCSDYDHMHSSTLFVTVIKHLDKNQWKVERSYFRLQALVQHWEKSDQELKHELWRNTNCWLFSTLYNALFSHRLILSLLSLMNRNASDGPYTVGWKLQNIIKRKIIQMWSHRLIKSLKFPKGDLLFLETTWH